MSATEQLYLADAYQAEFESTVVDTADGAVALAATAFYATGGGQPHDVGMLEWQGGQADVIDVRNNGGVIWHTLGEGQVPPTTGQTVTGTLDWGRRHQLMRTHTALHILCGVIWNEWGRAVTGGNMEPLRARMDFEFDPLPEGFAQTVTGLVSGEIEADRRIAISFLPRGEALEDKALIRTKVNLIPESVSTIRVVDIVGLDRQADGGTHVASTAEVGSFEIVKTESKGKGNKRLRIEIS
jgi:misacylated tRNA(Ala) deacylase